MTPQHRRLALAALAAVVLFVVATMGSVSSMGPIVTELPRDPIPVPTLEPPSAAPIESLPPQEEGEEEIEARGIPQWVADLGRTLVIGAIIVAIIAGVVAILRAAKPVDKRRAAAGGEALEVPEVDEEELEETFEEALTRLRAGLDVDDAVVECWRRLEVLAHGAGVTRRVTQTSDEFTLEVLAGTDIDEAALRELGSLYTQVNYSRHLLGDASRERAVECLTRLRESLGVGA